MRRLPSRRRGQSLIEAIVALGIITTAISSALTLAMNSLGAEKDSGASITAGNLAREGVEVVRMVRDSNWLANSAWDAGLVGGSAGNYDYTAVPVFDPAATGANWALDFTPNAVTDAAARVQRCASAGCPGMLGLFRQVVGTVPAGYVDSGYQRLLTIHPICKDGSVVTTTTGCVSPNVKIGLRVVSQVRWSFSGRAHVVNMEERLYDWR